MAISYCYWHLLVKNGNLILVLTSTSQEWQFHIATDIYWSRIAISHCYWYIVSRMAISHCYWHLGVKNGNLTLILTSSHQKWQFHIATDIYWSRMAIWHWYWHLVIKNGNFTLLLTSSGQECQFHIATDIYQSIMAISHCYWHLVFQMAISHCYWHLPVKNGNFTLLLICSGQEWQFHIGTDI